MTTCTMYDSTTPLESIPSGALAVAAYTTGHLGLLTQQVREAFPGATFVTIDAVGEDPSARVVDVEAGDMSPTGGAKWCLAKIQGGLGRPTIYCSLSLYSACSAALQSVGLAFGRDVDWWEADYDGVQVLSTLPGAVAKQFDSNTARNLDTSIALASWVGLHVPAPPVPAPPVPAPAPTQEVFMIPSNCTDDLAIRAQIREWWTTYRSDPMTAADQDVFLAFFHLPVTQEAWGKPGYGGSPDLLLAGIIDTAGAALRPQFAGAV